MSTYAELIPDELILAAIDRAMRHRHNVSAVTKNSIYLHLAIPTRSGPARHVHRRLPALEETGAVERARRNSATVWSVTSAGRRRLKRARRAGMVELPESPQHRAWRDAHLLAGQEIERLRRELRDRLIHALHAVDKQSQASSDVFFELAERLHRECRRFASASYCLHEWVEPDDAHADIDDRLEAGEQSLPRTERARLRSKRAGRRNVRYWSNPR